MSYCTDIVSKRAQLLKTSFPAKQAYEDAEDAFNIIEKAFSEATSSRNQLSRIRRVFRDVRRKQELDKLIDGLGKMIELPENSAAIVAQAESEDTAIEVRTGTLSEQLSSTKEELESLTFDRNITQRAADIREFYNRRIVILREKADLPKREAELNAAENALKTSAAELGWPAC